MLNVLSGGGETAQTAEPQKLIIVLSSQEPGIPDVATLIKGIREGLVDSRPTQFNIFVEHLDKPAAIGADDGTLRRLFSQKYASRDPDLIIALGADALEFAARSRSKLWTNIPIVFTGEPRMIKRYGTAANITGVAGAMETDRTLNTLLNLFPATKRIALINGSSPAEVDKKAEFLRDLSTYGDLLELVDLSGQPLETVKARLDTLADDTVAYFLSFRTDGTGRSFLAPEVLDVLAPTARRPIFGTSGTYFGHGIVGGWLIDFGQLGREVATQAIRVLDGEPASSIPVERSSSIRPMFDWRKLVEWRLGEDRLPAGSIVLFKQPTFWAQYRGWIMTALTALMLQALLITFLLMERTGRRRAEAKARQLSSEIIVATEAERTRIAQELHDDVSQRLALLSIEIDQFGGRPDVVGTGMAPHIKGLSGKTKDIADDIYNIAKELHPATLKLLGLVPAVRSFCTELEARHGLGIDVYEDGELSEIPEAVATGLYRVVQEALQNAMKHSGANSVSVSFVNKIHYIGVTIADNGCGIGPSADNTGTGLFSMRERLRLLGGTCDLRSDPQTGTLVEARVPWSLK